MYNVMSSLFISNSNRTWAARMLGGVKSFHEIDESRGCNCLTARWVSKQGPGEAAYACQLLANRLNLSRTSERCPSFNLIFTPSYDVSDLLPVMWTCTKHASGRWMTHIYHYTLDLTPRLPERKHTLESHPNQGNVIVYQGKAGDWVASRSGRIGKGRTKREARHRLEMACATPQ